MVVLASRKVGNISETCFMFIVFITVKIPKELLFMILEFFMSYIANQYRGISKTRLLNVVVIVLLLVNLDIWCKITFPK